jgi:hypothetical protein
MHYVLCLIAYGSGKLRMSITQAVYGDAADHVEVFCAVRIIKIAALSLNESYGEEVKYLQTVVFIEILNKA